MSGFHPRLQRASLQDSPEAAALQLTSDLEAMQAEFLRSGKDPAAKAVRVGNKPRVKFAPDTKPASEKPVQRDVKSSVSPMSVVNKIVERDVAPASTFKEPRKKEDTGFPKAFRLQREGISQNSNSRPRQKKRESLFARSRKVVKDETSESEQSPNTQVDLRKVRTTAIDDEIHEGNLQRIGGMSKEEIESAQAEIFSRFDAASLQALIAKSTGKRTEAMSRTAVKAESPPPTATTSRAITPKPSSPAEPSQPRNSQDLSWIQNEEDLWKAAQGLPVDEKRKLQWMRPEMFKDIDSAQDEQKGQAREHKSPRFGLDGNFLPLGVDGGSALYHHGDDPDQAGYTVHELGQLMRSSVVGQRVLAMRALAGILKQRSSVLWSPRRGTHPQETLPGDLALTVRCGIDDSSPAAQVPAMQCLESLLVPQVHEDEREAVAKALLGQEAWAPLAIAQGALGRFARAAEFGHFPQKEAKTEEQQEDGEDDADVLNERPVFGMVQAGVLQRMSYLLGCEPNAPPSGAKGAVAAPALKILVHFARHSAEAVAAILQHPTLVPGVTEQHVDITLEKWKSILDSNDSHAVAAIGQTLKLVLVLMQRQRAVAVRMLEQGVLGSSKRFLGFIASSSNSDPQTANGAMNSKVHFVVEQVLQMWRCALSYGLDGDDFLAFVPTLGSLIDKVPTASGTTWHLFATYMEYCLDQMRMEEFNDAEDNTTMPQKKINGHETITSEIGERVKYLVDDLLKDPSPVDATNMDFMAESSKFHMIEAYGRLLMGPKQHHLLSIEKDFTHEIRESQSSSTERDLGNICTIGHVRESVASTISKVCEHILVANGAKLLDAVTSTWFDVENDISRIDWVLSFVRGVMMCLDASKQFALGSINPENPSSSAITPLEEALRCSALFQVSLRNTFDELLSRFESERFVTFKLSLSPGAAYRSRGETLIACHIAQLLLRVTGRLTEPSCTDAAEARKRSLLMLHLGKRTVAYSGDEWIARNVTGSLLSSVNMSGIAAKTDCDIVTRDGRAALLGMYSNLFGGESVIRQSFARHTRQGHYTDSLVLGTTSMHGVAFSEAGAAWPALVLRMESPSETDSEAHNDSDLLFLVLHVARSLENLLSPGHLLLLLCQMVSHPRPEWLSLENVSALVVGLVQQCIQMMENVANGVDTIADSLSQVGIQTVQTTSKPPGVYFKTQLCRAAASEKNLLNICTRLVEGFVSHSFANAPSVYCILVFLRGDMAELATFEQVLLEIGESHLLHTLQVKENDLPTAKKWLTPKKEFVREKVSALYATALSQGILRKESDPLMYYVAVQHMSLIRETWHGQNLMKSIDSPIVLKDIQECER